MLTIQITTMPETTIPITTMPETTIFVSTSQIIPTSLNTCISTQVIDNASNGTIIYRKSSSGLSTGDICGIIIPCVSALLDIEVVAALFKDSTVISSDMASFLFNITPNLIDTSLGKFNVVQELSIQKPVEIIQPQPQPHIFEPQPFQQVVHPNYSVNKINPNVVNRAFQAMFNQQPLTQQVEIVPYQDVVPFQQVETIPTQQMVSIQQVEIVPTQEMVPHHEVVPVQNIRIAPNHEIVSIHQVGMFLHAEINSLQ